MPSRVDEGDTLERQLRLACAELERRLNSGEDCRAETIIERIPALASDPNCTIELIYAEFVIREELGQNPSPEEFFARFPQWRERLERQFQIHELLSGEEDLNPTQLLDLPLIPKPGDGAENYEVLEKIGQGAMGEVFKVLDRPLNRVVALKKIRPSASATEMVRFRQEAEKMAQLEHPNIVRVYAVGELNGLPFFSMELAPRGNLSQLIGGKSQSPKLTAQYGETLARAMHYAHLQNIIHRDLKPSNVVLTATGEPKITDFGLAKTVKEWTDESGAGGETRTQGEGEKSGGDGQYTGATETMRGAESAVSLPGSSCVPRNSSLTQTGVILGTPAYMSPEQAAGKSAEIGPRTDVYALGTILYEMLTGRAPFQGRSPLPIMKQVQEEDPRLPRSLNPKVDPELEAVCLKCLEKKPARRYDSADALAEDLRRWQRGERTRARPRRWIGRIRRMTRRPLFRRIVAALLIVGATYAATVALGVIQKSKPPPNPEEEAAKQEAEKRKLVFEELRRGNPVTLIDENGPLLLFPWRTNGETSKVFRTPDGSFSIQSWRTGLWELLPDPQIEKYRFNIEVRHDDNTDAANGRVGLYFSSIDYSSARGLEHCYLILAFNDLERQFPILPEGNSNDIVFKFENYCEPTMLTDSAWVLDPKKFIPAVGALSKPWRHLSVEVTPERIRVFWENNPSPIYDIDRSSLMARAKTFLRNSDIPEEIQPTFDTRGSLGLFVHRSSASFRRATVEPLAGDD